MNTEYEIKVLDIDVATTKKLLVSKGFRGQGSLKFRRYVFDTVSPSKDAWVRLRTDGKNTTLTYKKVYSDAIDGVEEIEIEVKDFEKTKMLLEAIGLKATSYQENERDVYKKGGVEVVIDRWPHIPSYLEIEGHNKSEVEETLQELILSSKKTTSLSTKEIYKLYGKNIDDYHELKF